ncbi:MAG TPA: tetratricopeptide repeat protein [Acetobacteraceae bacterium]|jgi:Tfp pilus assembly protein PilF
MPRSETLTSPPQIAEAARETPAAPHPRTAYLHGLELLRAGHAAKAAGLLTEAVAVLPTDERVHVNLVRALIAAEEPQRAVQAADAALALFPDQAELHFSRGTAQNMLGQPRTALASLQRAVALDPQHAPSLLNLGNACVDLDDLPAAETHIRAALERDPALAEAHASLGFVLAALGRLPEAIAACDAAIALRPDFVQAHWNLATAALRSGDYVRGFAEYEWRKRHDRFRRDFVNLPGPTWTGDDPAGRTILVHAEQGLGDTIQFARYLPLIVARGGNPVLACERPLLPWLGTLPGVRVVPKDAPLPRYDCWIDQMSLPHAFGTTPDTIPAAEGYLRADPVRVANWRARLPAGAKIGLAWAGNPAHSNDRRRSLPPDAVPHLRALAGDRAVNLQVGARAAEAGLPDLSPLLTDYAETAALVANLDLLLTVDTSVAHVAGALGVPCWLMLPHAPDWRWMPGRVDSPWYASLRVFRQPAPGDWCGVMEQVRTELGSLRAATGRRRPVANSQSTDGVRRVLRRGHTA